VAGAEPLIDPRDARVVVDDLDHPEAVCWVPRHERALAGGEAGQLYEFDLAGSSRERARVPGGNLLGIALDERGDAYVCDTGSGYVMRVDGAGESRAHGPKMTYPNYPAFDSDGNLWVSDSGAWGNEEGGLVRIAPDGSGERVGVGPFSFSNGLAVADGVAYLIASGDPALWRIDLEAEAAECIARFPRTVPDGVALDAEGGIWVSCFQPNRVYRVDVSGDVEVVLDDWSGEEMLSPTNVAFAGPDLRTLLLASLCGRTIRAVDVWVAGRPLEYPSVG
jgi:gluconolactonase